MTTSAFSRCDVHASGSLLSLQRYRMIVVVLVALLSDSAYATDASTQTPAEIAASQWVSTGWPLLETYCLDCHSSDYAEAEVDLSDFNTLEGVQRHSDLAVRVISMIRFAAMPPEDAAIPEIAERRELADRLDALVYHATCDLRPRPGRTTARRLNRAEYNNAIRDLFGTDLRPADQFPSDEVGGGFDNNADVLSLSTMLMDKYLTAAEQVTSQIIVDPDTLPRIEKTFSGDTLYVLGESRTGTFGQRYVEADGLAWFDVDVPVRGQYTIEVRGSSRVKSRGAVLATMHTADGILQGIFQLEHREGRSGEDFASTRMTLDAGTHRLFFRASTTPASQLDELKEHEDWQVDQSVLTSITEIDDAQIEKTRLPKGSVLEVDRDIDEERFPVRFLSVVVKGPHASTREDLPPGQKKLLGRIPERRRDRYVDVADAARKCLRPIMRRAFRGEVTDEDITPYVNVVKQMTDRGDTYYEAIRVAISAILVSPRFLFRIEVPEDEHQRKLAAAGDAIPLSSNQLASRLSFFLWSSLPDDQLLDVAKRGELQDPDKRMGHVRRMLNDKKSDSLGSQFARQWFGLGNLQSRDLSEFTEIGVGTTNSSAEITPAMLSSETEQLFLYLLRENRPISELLTSDMTFISRPLAQWYGVDFPSDADDSGVVPVNMGDRGRKGILGHAGVLLVTSYPTRNSPVQRGKWILENVLGTPPPEAPPGVPGLEETQTASADATLREQLELHRADPGCASCHRVMDSLGFGLEDYDHFGRLRSKDDPARGDATGELPGGRSFEGARELAALLAETEERALAETAVRRMLTFAIGRELRPSDRCFVEAILDKTQDEHFRVRDLLEQVILSPPFLNHQAEVPSS
ncbi:DUF1592 domain-containing protein [Aporhodopirellula aestuarii]|uniref:DUF1592 domain-containing protein n=1 Tax=Aporhodopirellula aestuarii TaxID=2950107 RepID=A0ABT0U812_9BACT|nr:DUF1592 domain-containing protein [Aporhodopirellula aestuarii]MCM2372947.1 DUF1592 domain-containing protein [Aporhodopirellula aestuarii]